MVVGGSVPIVDHLRPTDVRHQPQRLLRQPEEHRSIGGRQAMVILLVVGQQTTRLREQLLRRNDQLGNGSLGGRQRAQVGHGSSQAAQLVTGQVNVRAGRGVEGDKGLRGHATLEEVGATLQLPLNLLQVLVLGVGVEGVSGGGGRSRSILSYFFFLGRILLLDVIWKVRRSLLLLKLLLQRRRRRRRRPKRVLLNRWLF